ncbi:MAG: carbamoyltransferase [Saprospiraceae bacterium]|nr:carbamoyltransferase [Saprospiraceae bacterium]
MSILGISAFYHDAAAALIIDGEIIAAAQEERFTREKHTAAFPVHAIRYCLAEGGLLVDDLDAVVFYDKPLLKFERLLETYYAHAPRGLMSFLKAMPVWLHEKLFLKKLMRDGLAEVSAYDRKALTLLFSEHHLSHAASAFFPSPYETAAILTIDGVGEWATASICHGQGSSIQTLQELRFPHSVGLLYSAFTYFLGFKVNSGEYKLMGLAPYGDPESAETLGFVKKIKEHLVVIHEDGSIQLQQSYFRYATRLRMIDERRWAALFGMPRRLPESKIDQHHANLALAIQQVTEDIVLQMARNALALTQEEHLCLAGGVALNCVANGKLDRANLFESCFIQPAAGDAGGALGAALAVYHMHFKKGRSPQAPDGLKGSLLGPSYSNEEVNKMNRKQGWDAQFFESETDLVKTTAELLADGLVVGWFQGRMEYGPRALGNRSILADPRTPGMQQTLNLKIKFRERFRPFAPAVLEEDSGSLFALDHASPYMLMTAEVVHSARTALPPQFKDLPWQEKLQVGLSEVSAVTHVDYSARVQTVDSHRNPRFHKLLLAFKTLTKCPALVNTSFNVRGEPIVCTPEDAYACFIATGMDALVINDYLYLKQESKAH